MNPPFSLGPPFGMVKKIKSEWLAVSSSKMWTNFAGAVKNLHNVDLKEILGIELSRWREIGWG